MATKTITENVIATVSKGPLVVFVAFALGLWQASYMSDQQIATLERLTTVLNNEVGAAVYFAFGLLLFYALVLFPSGKFIATISAEFMEHQKEHARQHVEHVEASKAMFHKVTEIEDKCSQIHAKIDKFYGGEN